MEKPKGLRAEKIALYNQLVATNPCAEIKGATMPYTSINGHMYSYFTKDDYLALKLPTEERARFLDKYKTSLVEQYGIIQKEYVVVPDHLLENTDELKHYFEISYNYTSSLKPKPTTKSKKKD
jgi:hypothetical protein